MRIGVLSDTHLRSMSQGRQLAQLLFAGPFSDVAAILHAGDHVHPDLGLCFAPCPWYAVRGNMDSQQDGLPDKRILSFIGMRIGLIHGWGVAAEVETHILNKFADDMPDALVFGHTHRPVCRYVGATLIFNPGSATEPRSALAPSVGVLTLDDGISGEIISLV